MKISDTDVRDAFFDELYLLAKNDPDVVFLTADMGAHSLVRFKKELSRQYINVGIAEQNMVSVASGLTLGGKKVFIYTIIPFVTLRCYEQIKIDFCCMNLPVVIIGVGVGLVYGSDGPTHHGTQDIACMRLLPEMSILNPSDAVLTKVCVHIAYRNVGPTYVRIDRGKLPVIYNEKNNEFKDGLTELKKGSMLTIIASGFMVHNALKVAQDLESRNISTGVVDLFRIKPLNKRKLLAIISRTKHIVTLEENSIVGGIGSLVSEVLTDNKLNVALKRIAVSDEHCFETADREFLHSLYGLDAESVRKSILDWL